MKEFSIGVCIENVILKCSSLKKCCCILNKYQFKVDSHELFVKYGTGRYDGG